MKIILLQDVQKLGKKGEIVDVSGGYAKNALFPKKLAAFADTNTIQRFTVQKEKQEKENNERIAVLREIIPKLQAHTFEFHLKAGSAGELFESLHENTIQKTVADFCSQENQLLSLEDVHIHTKPIKQCGDIKIPAKIGRGMDAIKTDIAVKITQAK